LAPIPRVSILDPSLFFGPLWAGAVGAIQSEEERHRIRNAGAFVLACISALLLIPSTQFRLLARFSIKLGSPADHQSIWARVFES
jgi:hypothetical protein